MRDIARSLPDLYEALKPSQAPPTSLSFPFEWQEPAPTVKAFVSVTSELLRAFHEDSSSRAAHRFPMLATGSGMGKTRFGWESRHSINDYLLSQNLKLDQYLHVDFNGNGDPIADSDFLREPDVALALRLFARHVLHISLPHLRDLLLEEEYHLFKTHNVLKLIASLLRESTPCHCHCLTLLFLHAFYSSFLYFPRLHFNITLTCRF